MSHYFDSLKLEADQKDLLISELKAENFELKNKERHYHNMHTNIGGIEHECAIVSEDKRSMEEEMRRRSEADGVSIRKLREENESLVRSNQDSDHQLFVLKEEIAKLRAVNDGKAREISDLTDSINLREADNNAIRGQIQEAEKALSFELSEGTKLRADIGRTNDDIEKITADIVVTDNCIANRHTDIDGLNANIGKRMVDIDDKNKDITIGEGELIRLSDNLAKAKHDQANLKDRLAVEAETHHKLRVDQDHQNGLRVKIKDLEGENASRDVQIRVARDDLEKLKASFHASEDCNHNLEEELAVLTKHSDMLTSQNQVLNVELEEQVAHEEYVRRELDRKGKVSAIQKDNDVHLRESLHLLNEVKARSPIRRGR